MIAQEHLDLLLELRTDQKPHSGRELLHHLRGTYDLLEAWGNDPDVCVGGLFHSIYGTQSYKTESASLEDRARIRAVIGERAERLAFLFSMSQRKRFFEQIGKDAPHVWDRVSSEERPVTQAQARDLVELEVANYVEFMPRLDFTTAELDAFAAKVESVRELITSAAYAAIHEAIRKKRASAGE